MVHGCRGSASLSMLWDRQDLFWRAGLGAFCHGLFFPPYFCSYGPSASSFLNITVDLLQWGLALAEVPLLGFASPQSAGLNPAAGWAQHWGALGGAAGLGSSGGTSRALHRHQPDRASSWSPAGRECLSTPYVQGGEVRSAKTPFRAIEEGAGLSYPQHLLHAVQHCAPLLQWRTES